MMFSLTLSMLVVCFVAASLERWYSGIHKLGLILAQFALYLAIVSGGDPFSLLYIACVLLAGYHLWRLLMVFAQSLGMESLDEVRWF